MIIHVEAIFTSVQIYANPADAPTPETVASVSSATIHNGQLSAIAFMRFNAPPNAALEVSEIKTAVVRRFTLKMKGPQHEQS